MDQHPQTAPAVDALADATIRIRCEDCGEVDVPRLNLRLFEVDVPGRSWYSFDCTLCGQRDERSACPETCALLRLVVTTVHVRVPAEAMEEHPAQALTADDVLDALLVLRRSATPADLLRAWVLAVEAAADIPPGN